MPNYYKIIKKPMDLKRVKRKLQLRSSHYYKTLQDFVSDVRLVFNNCAKYNEVSGMSSSACFCVFMWGGKGWGVDGWYGHPACVRSCIWTRRYANAWVILLRASVTH